MAFIRRFRLPLAIAAALLLAYLDLQWVDTYRYPISTPDFFVYYLAAQIGQAHGWLAMYDPSIFLAAVTPIVGRPLPYLNPPELAWLVVPLAALPYAAAAWVWKGILIISGGLTCYLAAPGSRSTRILHVVAGALLLPVFIGFMFGQVSLLITLALAFSWWLIRREQPWLAGLALALTFLKPQAAFLVPIALLVAGYWRVFVTWLAATVLLAGAGLLAVGPSVFHKVADSLALVHGVAGPVQISLERQLALPVAVVGIGIVLATAALVSFRTRRDGPSTPIAVGIIASMLVSPYINFYDLSAMLLAGWFILAAHPPQWQRTLTSSMYVPLYLAPIWPLLTLACVLGWLLSLAALGVPMVIRRAEPDLAA